MPKKSGLSRNSLKSATLHENDVLLGRGNRTKNYSGNIRFREIVKGNRIDYNMSDTSQKRTIVNSVIHTVEEAGGRFLEMDDGADQWRVVDVKKVRRKVSQALRDSSMDSSINEGSVSAIANSNAEMSKKSGEHTSTTGVYPNENDVIFGRGRRNYNNKGNVLLRQLIQNWKNITTPISVEDRISSIIREVETTGGRFIDRENSASPWHVVDAAKVRRKIIQTWRQTNAGGEELNPSVPMSTDNPFASLALVLSSETAENETDSVIISKLLS